ncbi:MAG: heparan-alpha-glucosaminide N-acetyltransferase [Bacillota bacterium]
MGRRFAGRASGRLWEIDAMRGSAIVMMVVYHLAWDLNYFGLYKKDVTLGLWALFQKATVTAFIFLVGVSLWLSYVRRGRIRFTGYLVRGLKLLGLGFIATVITGQLFETGMIVFGILHFIGISVICAYPFIRWGLYNILPGAFCLGMGSVFTRMTADGPWLLWLGITPSGLFMLDYVPFFPWFGLVLLGISAGCIFYRGNGRRAYDRLPLSVPVSTPAGPEMRCGRVLFFPVRMLALLGRYSLFIYIVHQPVLFGCLFLVMR